MSWTDVAAISAADPPSEKERQEVLDLLRRRAKPTFYADENFPTQALRMTRAMRCRVVTAQEAGLRGHPDENQAAYALKKGYILVTCDRDYLNERRFPLVHCPVLAVFDFGCGYPSNGSIRLAFRCLDGALRCPQMYDKWIKLDANRHGWIELRRFRDGSTSKSRYRFHNGVLQEWVGE